MDAKRALMAPIERYEDVRVSKKKVFTDIKMMNNGNLVYHDVESKGKFDSDGSPLPKQQHFFRKASD